MKRKLMALGAVAALSFGLAGCSGGLGGEEGKVADRFQAFISGFTEGDGAKACDVMLGIDSKPMKADKTMFDACVTTYEKIGESMKDQNVGSVDVEKVVIDGDSAVLTAKDAGFLGGGNTADINFTKVDGEWYLDFSNM